MSTTSISSAELEALYKLIDAIHSSLDELRGEAEKIVVNSDVPGTTLQLNDVLKSTEDATTVILECANSIAADMDAAGVPAAVRDNVMGHVGRIFESCSFQDLTGQRIKKVLKSIIDLESQLVKLSGGRRPSAAPKTPENGLLNGPQLSGAAPSQSDIDRLFADK